MREARQGTGGFHEQPARVETEALLVGGEVEIGDAAIERERKPPGVGRRHRPVRQQPGRAAPHGQSPGRPGERASGRRPGFGSRRPGGMAHGDGPVGVADKWPGEDAVVTQCILHQRRHRWRTLAGSDGPDQLEGIGGPRRRGEQAQRKEAAEGAREAHRAVAPPWRQPEHGAGEQNRAQRVGRAPEAAGQHGQDPTHRTRHAAARAWRDQRQQPADRQRQQQHKGEYCVVGHGLAAGRTAERYFKIADRPRA
eukprot:scaffold11263_cov108-Isochrysis_galbana.AAC.2